MIEFKWSKLFFIYSLFHNGIGLKKFYSISLLFYFGEKIKIYIGNSYTMYYNKDAENFTKLLNGSNVNFEKSLMLHGLFLVKFFQCVEILKLGHVLISQD